MLPGVGIFGSDPITKILIQILRHFEFEIHAIWTNHYEIESSTFLTKNTAPSHFSTSPSDGNEESTPIKLITTSIDHVLLNKNVNLVFVCCPPNLHPQISMKALGIGKNVICIHPTSMNASDIEHMISSAYYYPSLFSSVSFGGLKYLNEFNLIKQSMGLVGDVKLCNIVINCQNIALLRSYCISSKLNQRNSRKSNIDESKQQQQQQSSRSSFSTSTGDTHRQRQASLSSLIDNIVYLASSSTSSSSLNWLSDRDLGAGVLNRFGAAMISLCLNLFDNNKVTKVYGSVRTLIEDINIKNNVFDSSATSPMANVGKTTSPVHEAHKRSGSLSSASPSPIVSTKSKMAPLLPNSSNQNPSQKCQQQRSRSSSNSIRKITADDYCTFQLRLEPASILVNVTINSIANCRYSQEISICGNKGVLTWNNDSKLLFKRTNINHHHSSTSSLNSVDSNNNGSDGSIRNKFTDSVESFENFVLTETEINSSEYLDQSAENFLSTYKNIEKKHPELPLIFIKGLYYYLAKVKQEFQARSNKLKAANTSTNSETPPTKNATPMNENSKSSVSTSLENFEHMKIVQLIVKSIQQSSELNRWVTVDY